MTRRPKNSALGETTLEHVTVIEIDGRGVMIHGPSGVGKTALALELMHRCRVASVPVALVADDYAFVSGDVDTGCLVAKVPDRIAGLVELRGYGVAAVGPGRHRPETRLALAVALCPADEAERVADPGRHLTLHGVEVPEMALLAGTPASSALAVLGWLGLAASVI
ncbi:HPr kinase/phosphorylase [Oricola cellulosilytica]|uniref:HPr kinase/phosphorylase C-terminal domain-containing protein n=1 Tax=Oricola cellulosilytica TaxID=1429082 RepID=A0A4R0PHH3_9HYPH|nr:hypothetical protein [Oricola cellulosilytica]TCD16020.1 hypothetical protein E0D97_00825 [Oricola cellulosilytica]